jgi:hypothetical protein
MKTLITRRAIIASRAAVPLALDTRIASAAPGPSPHIFGKD